LRLLRSGAVLPFQISGTTLSFVIPGISVFEIALIELESA